MNEEPATPTASRQRSPNYPANSLVESISDARKVYDNEKTTVLNQESLARAMGYSGLNGASRTKIASLRKYGLVESVGDKSKISQLALRILHRPETSTEYLEAVREAALRPELFKQFYETHREASEQSIQSELIIGGRFIPDAAKAFAKAFRETILFAKLDQSQYYPQDVADKTGDKSGNGATPPQKPSTPSKPVAVASTIQPGELPVPIAEGLVARVPFPMSEDDFDLLLETLKLWKKKLVRKATAIPPTIPLPANAMWKTEEISKPVKIVALMGEKDGERYYQSEDGTGIPESQLVF